MPRRNDDTDQQTDEQAAAAGGAPVDVPGKDPEPAAQSGVVPAPTPGVAPLGQGAQVVLTGLAQAAARGGLHGDIHANTAARDKAIADGHIETATAAAAKAAIGIPTLDEIDEAEVAALDEVRAKFRDLRAERAAKAIQ